MLIHLTYRSVILWMKESGLKNVIGMIGMVDKEMILGGIACATTYIMLLMLVVELISTGGLQCLV